MRSLKDILRIVEGALAAYGAYCLIGGKASEKISKNWERMLEKTEESFTRLIFGEEYKRPIECEYRVEDAR